MNNKLSVFYEHIFEATEQNGSTAAKMLEYAVNCGIDGLECDLWRLDDKSNVKSFFDSCGVKVSSIYNFFDFLHEDRNTCEVKYRKILETAAYFGTDKVLCVPGFIGDKEQMSECRKIVAERLNEMCTPAKEYGVTVTLEDFDDEKSPCCTTEGLLYFMQNVDGLRYTFDTGNFRYCLESADKAYSVLKDYVVHVHLKDRSYDIANADPNNTNGKADLSGAIMYPSIVCEGVIGIDELIGKLVADDYSGRFAIEHFGAVNQAEYMKKSAENIRKVLTK